MNTFPARTTNSGRLDPTKGSLARQILCTMSTKGSEKGRETNDANGHPELNKGRETNAANGHQGLKKGRETNAANGHQKLKKGRETQAANGHQKLKKGRKTQRRAFKKLANAKWQALQNGPVLV